MKAWYLVLGLVGLSTVVRAKDRDVSPPRAEVFQKVIDCRAIADGTQRLACYDAQVARLDEASARKEVMVIDQAEVKRTRKGLFGFNFNDLGLFGGDDDKSQEEGVNQIESTVRSARQDGSGKWIITLEDGAKWTQTDSSSIRDPKPGQPIKVRKAAMGSYFANVNGQRAIRVTRQN